MSKWTYIFLAFFTPATVFAKSLPHPLRFATKEIVLSGHNLIVEIADNDVKREQGLMNRTRLRTGRGMLFVMDNSQILYFWMKNTRIPLSIGFFDNTKTLINTEDMFPTQEKDERLIPRYSSQGPALYALELPLGWFKKNKVQPGAKFEFINKK